MIAHGTRRGYQQHSSQHGDPPCDACRAAHAAYYRNWRHQRAENSQGLKALQASRSAMQRLALRHPDEYSALLAEERAKRGVAA